MTEEFDFIMLEERTGQYLGSNPRNVAANATNDKIDKKVMEIISEAHQKAYQILEANIDKLHEISQYLLEKETISGEEFMDILNNDYVLTTKNPKFAGILGTNVPVAETTEEVVEKDNGESIVHEDIIPDLPESEE